MVALLATTGCKSIDNYFEGELLDTEELNSKIEEVTSDAITLKSAVAKKNLETMLVAIDETYKSDIATTASVTAYNKLADELDVIDLSLLQLSIRKGILLSSVVFEWITTDTPSFTTAFKQLQEFRGKYLEKNGIDYYAQPTEHGEFKGIICGSLQDNNGDVDTNVKVVSNPVGGQDMVNEKVYPSKELNPYERVLQDLKFRGSLNIASIDFKNRSDSLAIRESCDNCNVTVPQFISWHTNGYVGNSIAVGTKYVRAIPVVVHKVTSDGNVVFADVGKDEYREVAVDVFVEEYRKV